MTEPREFCGMDRKGWAIVLGFLALCIAAAIYLPYPGQ